MSSYDSDNPNYLKERSRESFKDAFQRGVFLPFVKGGLFLVMNTEKILLPTYETQHSYFEFGALS